MNLHQSTLLNFSPVSSQVQSAFLLILNMESKCIHLPWTCMEETPGHTNVQHPTPPHYTIPKKRKNLTSLFIIIFS